MRYNTQKHANPTIDDYVATWVNITNETSGLTVTADHTHKEDSPYLLADKDLGGYIMSVKNGKSVVICK